MTKINSSSNNTFTVKANIGDMTFPKNSVYFIMDESGYVMFKSLQNDKVLFSDNIGNIEIEGGIADKDNINELFSIAATTDAKESSVNNVNLTVKGNYLTEDELAKKGYLTAIPEGYVTINELAEALKAYQMKGAYVTKGELEEKKYLSEIPSNLVTLRQLDKKLEEFQPSGDYVTNSALARMNYITTIPSQYVTSIDVANTLKNYQPKGMYATTSDLKNYQEKGEYVTSKGLEGKGYIKEHQSLDKYYTKDEINKILGDISAIIKKIKTMR